MRTIEIPQAVLDKLIRFQKEMEQVRTLYLRSVDDLRARSSDVLEVFMEMSGVRIEEDESATVDVENRVLVITKACDPDVGAQPTP